MNINLVNLNNNYFTKSPVNFKSKYNFIQHEEDLPCACCGKTMLNDDQLNRMYRELNKREKPYRDIFRPYYAKLPQKSKDAIKKLIEVSEKPENSNKTFKSICNLCTDIDEYFYHPDANAVFRKILYPATSTVEHVIPKSLGGKDSYTNFVRMCGECNGFRSSKDYPEIMQQNPDFVQNMVNFLKEIKARKTYNKDMALPDDYIPQIKLTLTENGIDSKFLAEI